MVRLGHSISMAATFTKQLTDIQAHRVSRISDVIPPNRWRHVRTDDNPADFASRGVPIHDLTTSKLWRNGPGWLSLCPGDWPRRLAQDGPSWQKRHIRSKTSCGSDNNTQTGTMEPLVEIFQLQSFGKDRRQNLESHREDEE